MKDTPLSGERRGRWATGGASAPGGTSPLSLGVKRAADCAAAAVGLAVFSPLFLACYLAVRLDDGGPAIFRQERIGRFGRPFTIYKFRTMRSDAEASGPRLSHGGGDGDPRLTRVGRFLRAHHLDELPQLWNVFTGDVEALRVCPLAISTRRARTR